MVFGTGMQQTAHACPTCTHVTYDPHTCSHIGKTGVIVVIAVKSVLDRLILSFHPALSGELPSTTVPLCKLLHNRFFYLVLNIPQCAASSTPFTTFL